MRTRAANVAETQKAVEETKEEETFFCFWKLVNERVQSFDFTNISLSKI